MRDEDLIHGATDIESLDESLGYRDIWVISINPWADRKYGTEFEQYATSEFDIPTVNTLPTQNGNVT